MNFFRKADRVADSAAGVAAAGPKGAADASREVEAAGSADATCKDEPVMVSHPDGAAGSGAAAASPAAAPVEAPVGTEEAAGPVDDEGEGGEADMSNVPLNSSHSEADDPSGEHSDGEYDEGHSDHSDDDSEYTYETVEEEAETKGGWFGFLRRKKNDDDEEFTSDEEHSDDDGDEDEEGGKDEEDIKKGGDVNEEEHESSDGEHGTHHLLNSSFSSPRDSKPKDETEDAVLMAQAIQRVQERIESSGGNLYNALSEDDKKLVDALKGVKDEDKIREVVGARMDEEEKARKQEGPKSGGLDDAEFNELLGGDRASETQPGGDGNEVATEPSLHTEPSLDTEPSLPTQDMETMTDFQRKPSKTDREPAHPSVEGVSKIDEPELHEEPPVDEEPRRESLVSSDGDDDEEDDYGGSSGYEEEGEGEEGGESGYDGDETEETEDDESPTLEEQRSLLSLAAEHDRVDVIKELLQDRTLHDILLAGIDGSEETEGGKDVTFVPPPLHAAVAHGSINAASCLLRMGADPSIRPVVPAQYLSGSYQPSPLKRSGSGANMEEDRNFKKYHGMSAWELAFGSTVVVEEGDGVEEIQEEEVQEEKRGWFGFGSPKKEEPAIESIEEHSDGKVRVRRKLPLNIPAAKLEGIRHAFTAEALRAIGSDEVERLDQLLDAGMEGGMEVAGKTLIEWAKEMDAKGCCELLNDGAEDEEEEAAEGDGAAQEDAGVDGTAEDDVKAEEDAAEAPPGPLQTEEAVIQQMQPPPIHDERLVGLSLLDIQTLTRENVALIPQLTQVRDDLASETSICKSILQDVEATGGRGGLSSESLLELVRGLKDQRARAEEAADAWTRALEEREDELDFFWEEVLDDRMRDELGGILGSVEVEDPSVQGLTTNGGNSMEECVRRFVEADDRVSSLRASIANLAEESSKSLAEIERHGMSGALSLTRSLREEIKGFETTMRDAIMGEGLCRRKIEIIQSRLGNGNDDTATGAVGGVSQGDEVLEQGYYTDEAHVSGEEEADASTEDYQLQTIVQQQEQQQMQQRQGEPGADSGSPSLPAPVEQGEVPAQVEGASPTESVPELNGTGEEKALPTAQESDVPQVEVEEEEDGEIIESPGESPETEPSLHTEPSLDTEPTPPHSDVETMTAFERKASKTDREPSPPRAADEDEMMTAFERKPSKADSEPLKEAFVAGDAGASPSTKEPEIDSGSASKIDANDVDEQAPKPSNTASAKAAAVESVQQPKAKKPSEAIAEGVSTAIVVHKPNAQASLSSQIWEILRRIVGLSRVAPRSDSYHDENHPHIMIV